MREQRTVKRRKKKKTRREILFLAYLRESAIPPSMELELDTATLLSKAHRSDRRIDSGNNVVTNLVAIVLKRPAHCEIPMAI